MSAAQEVPAAGGSDGCAHGLNMSGRPSPWSRDVGSGSYFALRGPKAASSAGGREEEVREPHDALRGQKRPPPGTRPALFAEVAEPQNVAVTVGYVASTVLLLAQPVLGGGDSLNVTAVQFLLAQSLLQRQRGRAQEGHGRGEEGERRAEGEARGQDAGDQPSRPRRDRHAC